MRTPISLRVASHEQQSLYAPIPRKANTNALVIDTASNSRTITMTNNCPHPSPGGAALEMRFRERSYVRAEGPSKMQNPAHLFVKRDLYFAGRRVRRASSSAAAKTLPRRVAVGLGRQGFYAPHRAPADGSGAVGRPRCTNCPARQEDPSRIRRHQPPAGAPCSSEAQWGVSGAALFSLGRRSTSSTSAH